jgi:hypothetical protein
MRQPLAELTNRGAPPTADHARTGEFTPPGIVRRARSNHIVDVCFDSFTLIGQPSRANDYDVATRFAKSRYLATLENCETKFLQRSARNTKHRASTHVAELTLASHVQAPNGRTLDSRRKRNGEIGTRALWTIHRGG